MNQMTPAANPGLTRCRAVALLVDGENLSPDHAGQMITTTGREIGRIAVQRVYGDVTRLNGWLSAPGFRAMHAHAGKNVTDMLMTVEAMELSFGGQIDGFAIATRDRDFAPLAWSLRARGFPVLGLLPADASSAHLSRAFCQSVVLARNPPRAAAPGVPQAPPDGLRETGLPDRVAAAKPVPATLPDLGEATVSPELLKVIRAILAKGPMSTSAFGNALGQAGYTAMKGTQSWEAWFSRRPGLARFTGSGSAATIDKP
jgi:uncharacterized protein (TIGR00288 family)